LRSIAYTLFLENNGCITMTELPRTELSIALSPAERKALKARAHHLDPVVLIGDAGLTPGVMREVDLALRSHELIKVRVAGDDREARLAASAQICDELGAASVQQIGKLLVLYRPLPIEAESTTRPKRPRGPRKTKKQLAAAPAPTPAARPARKRRA